MSYVLYLTGIHSISNTRTIIRLLKIKKADIIKLIVNPSSTFTSSL